MYSRYSGISIPKNYGGSRFSELKETNTKTHRAESMGATKSAHSPSFVTSSRKNESKIISEEESSNSTITEEYTDTFSSIEEITDTYPVKEDEAVDYFSLDEYSDVSEKSEKEEPELAKTNNLSTRQSVFNFEALKSLFTDKSSEELLILGIILLLVGDGIKKNEDIVTALILLFLSGKDFSLKA